MNWSERIEGLPVSAHVGKSTLGERLDTAREQSSFIVPTPSDSQEGGLLGWRFGVGIPEGEGRQRQSLTPRRRVGALASSARQPGAAGVGARYNRSLEWTSPRRSPLYDVFIGLAPQLQR